MEIRIIFLLAFFSPKKKIGDDFFNDTRHD